MPRLPRVSGAEAIRALERLGFAQVRQRGSHVILSALDQIESLVVSFRCIRNLQAEHCAES